MRRRSSRQMPGSARTKRCLESTYAHSPYTVYYYLQYAGYAPLPLRQIRGMQIITYLSVLLLILLTLHLWLRRVCRLPRRPTILSLELEGDRGKEAKERAVVEEFSTFYFVRTTIHTP